MENEPAYIGKGPEANKTYRNSAVLWVSSSLFVPKLLTQTFLFLPVHSLLIKQLDRSSAAYVKKQMARLARGLGPIDVPLLRAARLELEATAHAELGVLLHDSNDLWKLCPLHTRTVAIQNWFFKTYSQLSCLLFELLISPRQKFPYPAFLWVDLPSLAGAVDAALSCCKHGFDKWLQSWVNYWKGSVSVYLSFS